MKISKELVTIFLIMLTEVLGFSLILPFLPFYAQEFGASDFQIGLLFAMFSFFQLFSAPIMGQLSDRYGRRPLLIISQISTMASFVVLGLANSLFMLFASRVIDGAFGSNFTIADSYLSDISSKKDRSKYFGVSGIAFGLGFMVGPGIGGYLSQFGFGVPAFLAAFLALITIFMTYFFLPETVTRGERQPINMKVVDLDAFSRYFAAPRLSGHLWEFFLYLLTHSLWVSTFALFVQDKLQFTAAEVGILLTVMGSLSVLVRGLLPKLITIVGEADLKLLGTATLIASLLLTVVSTERWLFYIVMVGFAFGSGVVRPLMQGSISRQVSQEEQGAVLGITGSLASVSQFVGPLAGGLLMQQLGANWLSLTGALLMSAVLWLLLKNSTQTAIVVPTKKSRRGGHRDFSSR